MNKRIKKLIATTLLISLLGITGCGNSNKTDNSTKDKTKNNSAVAKKTNTDNASPKLKITTLAENKNEEHQTLQNEFGFSVLIEYGDKKVIFDTGKAGEFIKNAEKMNVDISKVDDMVLSHAHYDHCGGLMPYLNKYDAKDTKLYLKDSFFELSDNKYYYDKIGQKFDFTDGKPGYFPVGINFKEKDVTDKGVKISYVNGDSQDMEKGITVHGHFTINKGDKLAPNMLVKDGNKYIVDDFDEEVAVSIETDKGLVILSGCSHTGILNIVNTVQQRTGKKVYAVIGGFHLLDASDEKIQSTIDRFKELGVEKIGLSHCTGPKATKMFKEQMPNQTFVNETGSIYEN